MPHEVFANATAQGSTVYGGWVTTDSLAVVEAVERSGVDWIGFDCQHGGLSEASAAGMIKQMQHSPCATLVRVADESASLIARVLDVGADAVLIPMIDDAAQAQHVVAACQYPPAGNRSFGPARSDLPFSPALMQERVSCFVMIETAAGLRNADEICAVPGLAGVIVGPSDLAIGLGIDPVTAFTSEEFDAAITTLGEACSRNGLFFGMFCKNGADAARWTGRGCQVIIIGAALTALTRGLATELSAARA